MYPEIYVIEIQYFSQAEIDKNRVHMPQLFVCSATGLYT